VKNSGGEQDAAQYISDKDFQSFAVDFCGEHDCGGVRSGSDTTATADKCSRANKRTRANKRARTDDGSGDNRAATDSGIGRRRDKSWLGDGCRWTG
jgi:hypothetical protein